MLETSSPEKREKETLILDAALKVIKKKGFHKARMSDIARQAGTSYGLVYHYFRNKEDLFDAIINRWWESLFFLMDEASSNESQVRIKLKRIITHFLDTYQAQPDLMSIFITEISRSTVNLTSRRLEQFKEFMTRTESVVIEGQEKGVLRKDFKARYLTYIFLGSIETFLSAMVLVNQSISNEGQKQRISESILEVFLNGASTR